MIYMRNRYYDPGTGRVTQRDPIGLAGGLNQYGYAGGDPVNYSDPFGLCRDKAGKHVPCPDKEKVAQWVTENAGTSSRGECAKQCRRALEAGGFDSEGRPGSAGDYGPFLIERGAGAVPAEGYTPETGDMAVFEKNATHPHGHIQIFNGTQWVSDWAQRNFNPYRRPETAGKATIYRFPGMLPAVVITP
jgi:hypothetical protein